MRSWATTRLFFAATRCLRVRGEIAVDALELDVRVVVGLDRLLEVRRSGCSTSAMIASACARFDVIVCADADPTASSSPAAPAASENGYRRPSGARAPEGGSPSSPDRPAGGGLARHKSETLAASTDACNLQQSQNLCKEGALQRRHQHAACVRVLRLVGRGTRRWGAALVAVLTGMLVGAGGSALRPAAGSTGVPTQGRRRRLLPPRQDRARRPRAQGCRRSRPEADPARNEAARPRLRSRRSPRTSGRRSRGESSTSGSRARPRPARGAGAPSRSPSIASGPGRRRRVALHRSLMTRARVAVATLVVAVALPAGTSSTSHAAPADLDVALAQALNAPGIDARRTAAIAVDLRSGETVYSKNARLSLLPASTEKLAVSFAALRVLGPRYRFRTEVMGVGSRSGARLERQPLARRIRRSDALPIGPRPSRTEVRRHRNQQGRRSRLRGRHALRRAPRRTRLEAVVRRHRVETAVRPCRRRCLVRRS